jgi:hypothetical protein
LFPPNLLPNFMKKTLLALTLLAFTGAAAFAHDGNDKDGKKGKKKEASATSHCGGAAAGLGSTPSCCMKKGAKASAATTAPASAPAAKSL